MSTSSTPRIKRSPGPNKKLKRYNYRKEAMPFLLRDFGNRCAYSMQHIDMAGGLKHMEVDHFNPTLRERKRHAYSNLFLATRHCNGAKSDWWPKPQELKLGIRFLDCCAEEDYGVHIKEVRDTHEVVGLTPAGKYHIRMCDLNAPHFTRERARRAELREVLNRSALFTMKRGVTYEMLYGITSTLRKNLELMIPEIPYA